MASAEKSLTYVNGKETVDHLEHTQGNMRQAVVAKTMKTFGDNRIEVSTADNKRILTLTDTYILPILIWVYFLQILDKSMLGYAALFGLKNDADLTGDQFSLIGSMNAISQLAWQPFSSYLLVRVPPRVLMSVLVFGWGSAMLGMAGSHNYGGFVASRFLLGLFEGACLPLFAILTSVWYRRAEQPMRVCLWYSTNGLATIIGSAMSFGLGHIKSGTLHSYQIIFLVTGLFTVLTPPLIYWRIDNSIIEARFLSQEDRHKGVERLRANNTGTYTTGSYKWPQVFEALIEPKTWLFFAMTLLVNVGAAVTNVFGPLILSGIGLDTYTTSLLNMPFGAVQVLVIGLASYTAYHFKTKSVVLAALVLPVIAGLAVLYSMDASTAGIGPLLVAYYLLAFLFGSNPLLVSWISANTAGSTKKSVLFSVYNAASSAGNIVGPFLFNSKDAPRYTKGLEACLAIFGLLFLCIILQLLNFMILNKRKARQRAARGKPAYIHDVSMDKTYSAGPPDEQGKKENEVGEGVLGQNAFLDMTDAQNDEFVYVY